MPNPFNPLDWVKSAQDWFTKTERSSGFRPYLIFLILDYGLCIILLSFFGQLAEIRQLSVWLMGGGALAFVALFAAKAFQDPEFCRSESHVQKVLRIQLENFGTETEVIDASMVDAELMSSSEPERVTDLLPSGTEEEP